MLMTVSTGVAPPPLVRTTCHFVGAARMSRIIVPSVALLLLLGEITGIAAASTALIASL
jgi:hypothetical protein